MDAAIKFFTPNKPTGQIIQPDGTYSSTRTLGDNPLICPECTMPTWTVHAPFPDTIVMVCSGCFRKVKDQGGLTKKSE